MMVPGGTYARPVGIQARPRNIPRSLPGPNIHKSLAIVYALAPGGGEFKQTGFVVSYDEKTKHALICTNSHLCRSIRNPRIYAGTTTNNGRAIPAKIIYRGNANVETDDILLVSVKCDAEPKVLPLAKRATGTVYMRGYAGSDLRQTRAVGPVLSPGGLRTSTVVGFPARSGHSGSPIVNAKGELVAMCWGTDGATSRAVSAQRIRQVCSQVVVQQNRGFLRRLFCGRGQQIVINQPSPQPQLPISLPGNGDSDLSERVSQLETLLTTLKERQNQDRDARLLTIVESIRNRIESVDDRLETLEGQVQSLDSRLTALETAP